MGFFSYNCGACCKPVLNIFAAGRDWPQAALVTVFTDDGSIIKGEYGGYGDVGGIELNERDESTWRIAHQMCCEGQSFKTLKKPESDEAQGFFYSDEQLTKYFGPPAVKASP